MFGLQSQTPATHAESLSGLIERVTFFSEENGSAVLKLKAKGHRARVTMDSPGSLTDENGSRP